jgi:hypothetical protein
MSKIEQNLLNQTREIIESSKDTLIKCIEDMNEHAHNQNLQGGDATDWVVKYQKMRDKLNDCEDILDDLKEKYSNTCFTYEDS